MPKREINCVVCGKKTEKAMDISIISTIQGREIIIAGLTGTRCSECHEQYIDAQSSRKAMETANKYRMPAIVFKRKITTSGGQRVIGIPEEIIKALGKKENANIWLEGNKIVAEVY